MAAIILFGIFFLLLFMNMPIAFALGISSLAVILFEGLPLMPIASNLYAATSKFVLLAIPFFILGGNVMDKSGISTQLIDFARTLVGHRRSGMALVTVIVACFFAAISGSGPATVAALGMILPVGGFLTLACVIATMQHFLSRAKAKQEAVEREEVSK